jgi:guanylate kinase
MSNLETNQPEQSVIPPNLKKMLITITGPSASGKTELIKKLSDKYRFERLISVTTRPPRAGEVDGLDYYFITENEFKTVQEAGYLVQSTVFNDSSYGTTVFELERVFASGKTPIVIVEPTGIPQFRDICEKHGIELFTIYVHASHETLIERYVTRITEVGDPARLRYHAKRIYNIYKELDWRTKWFYNFIVYNDSNNWISLDEAASSINLAIDLLKDRSLSMPLEL